MGRRVFGFELRDAADDSQVTTPLLVDGAVGEQPDEGVDGDRAVVRVHEPVAHVKATISANGDGATVEPQYHGPGAGRTTPVPTSIPPTAPPHPPKPHPRGRGRNTSRIENAT